MDTRATKRAKVDTTPPSPKATRYCPAMARRVYERERQAYILLKNDRYACGQLLIKGEKLQREGRPGEAHELISATMKAYCSDSSNVTQGTRRYMSSTFDGRLHIRDDRF